MIHVVVMNCLVLSFYEGVGVGVGVGVEVLKVEESESEVLCTDSTALVMTCCSVISGRYRQYIPPKRRYSPSVQHVVITERDIIQILTCVDTDTAIEIY
jgi:hypothetical protein